MSILKKFIIIFIYMFYKKFLYFLFLLSNINLVFCSNNELILRNDIFNNYSSSIRPLLNSSNKIKIEMGIGIKNLEEFNQKVETVKLNLWLRMNWKNEYLSWNSSQYGIDFLSVNEQEVWIPDVELLNAASLPEIYTLKGGMNLYSSGEIMYSRPGIFKFSCPLRLEKFPYDTQSCKFTFSSWVYSIDFLELVPYDSQSKAIDILDTFSHSEWKVEEVYYTKKDILENDAIKNSIEYTIKLSRYPHYYSLSIGMTMTLVYVSFIIMLVAPDNLSRTGTAVFIPLTILALQLTIADKVPVVGYYTLMDKFFLSCFVSSMFVSMVSGLIYTLLVTNSKTFFKLVSKYVDFDKYKRKDNIIILKETIDNIEENKIYEKNTDKVYKVINYDDSFLSLSKEDIIIKGVIRKYVVFIDNILRVLCPLIFTIYVAVLIGSK